MRRWPLCHTSRRRTTTALTPSRSRRATWAWRRGAKGGGGGGMGRGTSGLGVGGAGGGRSDADTTAGTVSAGTDAPSFTKGAGRGAFHEGKPHTIAGWATHIAAGPPDE